MLYRNDDGRPPSLLVEDGETVKISARGELATGIPVLKMRPRTTAALLVMAGRPAPAAPRLSDRSAFEEIERTDGLVSLSERDQDGRIDGYSIPFLRGVMEALDPNDRVPPKSVKRLIPLFEEDDCGCSASQGHLRKQTSVMSARGTNAAAVAESSLDSLLTHSVRESFVPDFVATLKVFDWVIRLGDVVVGRNATLVLDSDIYFAWADNFLAYKGSRIVQRASYLYLDVSATMRGGILGVVHAATDVLKVNWAELAAEQPTKP